jgi:hypothetical protein
MNKKMNLVTLTGLIAGSLSFTPIANADDISIRQVAT